jgi:hypothetical protein
MTDTTNTTNTTNAEEKRQQTPAEIYEEARRVLPTELFKIVLSYYHGSTSYTPTSTYLKKKTIEYKVNYCYKYRDINYYTFNYEEYHKLNEYIKLRQLLKKHYIEDSIINNRELKETKKTIDFMIMRRPDYSTDMFSYRRILNDKIKADIPKPEDIIYKDVIYSEDDKKIKNSSYDFLNSYFWQVYIYNRNVTYNRKEGGGKCKWLKKYIKKMTIYTTVTKIDNYNQRIQIYTYIKINNDIYQKAFMSPISEYNKLKWNYFRKFKDKEIRTTYEGYKGYNQCQHDKDLYDIAYGRLYDDVIEELLQQQRIDCTIC